MTNMAQLAERIIAAFTHYGCFIFEKQELENVKTLVALSGLGELVEIRLVDERYPDIYILTTWTRQVERECILKIKELASRSEITSIEYKKYRRELIEQCIISKSREHARKTVELLEEYLRKMK